jgi:putative transposase
LKAQKPLRPDRFSHIYNCGINGENLFREPENYEHFLHLYDKFISQVAGTYAWVLMGNHFHLLVRVKGGIVYNYSNADRSIDAVRFEEVKWETIEMPDLSSSEGHDSVKIPDAENMGINAGRYVLTLVGMC